MGAGLQELKDSSANIARFIENAKRCSEIPELTAEILRIFIKRGGLESVRRNTPAQHRRRYASAAVTLGWWTNCLRVW